MKKRGAILFAILGVVFLFIFFLMNYKLDSNDFREMYPFFSLPKDFTVDLLYDEGFTDGERLAALTFTDKAKEEIKIENMDPKVKKISKDEFLEGMKKISLEPNYLSFLEKNLIPLIEEDNNPNLYFYKKNDNYLLLLYIPEKGNTGYLAVYY